MRRLLLAAQLGLLGIVSIVGLASVGVAASQQSHPTVQPFQLSDQHGSMQRIEPSARNTLIYFYRGDW